nr:nitrogenase iron-molybdenum cofactor biosynthesis protein NifE [Dethiosulfatibacter aminovorans]
MIEERKDFIMEKSGGSQRDIKCEENSLAGVVSQRACVYCGARVVLNPITDAYHIIHGPIGCASYTWDLRGSLTSGVETFRTSFSTDLSETDIVFGGEKKLAGAISEIVENYDPKVIFVYSTCVVGVIGDDVDAVCRKAEEKYNIRVIPVKSTGFAGNKSSGYKAACHAIMDLMGEPKEKVEGNKINFLGDFNLAGELWINEGYLNKMGVEIISRFTGDSTCQELQEASRAKLNIVQCAGSMTYLAKMMKEKYGIPFINISFYGLEDIEDTLRKIAFALGDVEVIEKAKKLINEELPKTKEIINEYRERLEGKKAAIYVGGGFKAISLIKQFKELGMEIVMVGTQTGKQHEYENIRELCDEGTIILDDANPAELEAFMKEKGADILVGGVKERPLAYKLGVAFCDHNHERKHPLNGFVGAVNFAREIDLTINSPVWKYIRKKAGESYE